MSWLNDYYFSSSIKSFLTKMHKTEQFCSSFYLPYFFMVYTDHQKLCYKCIVQFVMVWQYQICVYYSMFEDLMRFSNLFIILPYCSPPFWKHPYCPLQCFQSIMDDVTYSHDCEPITASALTCLHVRHMDPEAIGSQSRDFIAWEPSEHMGAAETLDGARTIFLFFLFQVSDGQ